MNLLKKSAEINLLKSKLFNILYLYTVKKKDFKDLLSQHFFFCQINLNKLFSSDNLLIWVFDD